MFIDLLFPQRCIGCTRWGASLCADCFKNIQPTQADVCPACFGPSLSGQTHSFCQNKTSLSGALSIVRYKGITRKVIKETKYRRAHKILDDFFSQIPKNWCEKFLTLSEKNPKAVLCPIPLHKTRFKTRGFNQADIITKYFSSITKLNINPLLKRIKNTSPQALQNSRKERKENIYRAFETCSNMKIPKTIILIDDLFTSANTANEAAQTLKKYGAQSVYLFVVAHGL